MSASKWVVIADNGQWQIGRVTMNGPVIEAVDVSALSPSDASEPAVTTPDEVAERIVCVLYERGYAGDGVLLGLDSRTCLAATVTGSTVSRERHSMAYALEEWLPLAAEEIVADFVVSGHDALGVAVETANLKPLVDALESHGVIVQSISPTALLALQQTTSSDNNDKYMVVWEHGDHVEVFLLVGGAPCSWQLLAGDSQAVLQQIRVLALSESEPLGLAIFGGKSELLNCLTTLSDVQLDEVSDCDTSGLARFLDSATIAADEVLSGKRPPWIELRQGALAAPDTYRPVRRLLRFTHVAAALFLIAVAVGLLGRAHRYAQQARQIQQQQRAIFCEAYPNLPVPRGIRARLESETTKLAGITGQATDLPTVTSALSLLYDVLRSLPNGIRYRVLEIRLEDGCLDLEAEVRSHGDAERISASLKEGGFQVEPPRSEQFSDRGVAVRIRAEIAES